MEDEVDRDKRRESAEKQKSAKDFEKRRKRRRISSDKCWRHVGRTFSLSMSTATATRATTAATILRVWRPVSTESSRAHLKPTSSSHGREPLRGIEWVPRWPAGGVHSAPFSRRHPSRAYTRSDRPPPQPPPASKAGHRVKSLATGPLTRGRAAASSKGEISHRSTSLGAHQAGDDEPRPAPARAGPGASTRGGSRPASRGAGRRVALSVG